VVRRVWVWLMAKCQWLMAILVFKDHHFHHQLLGACFHYASLHPPNQLNFGLIFIALQKMPLTSKQCRMFTCCQQRVFAQVRGDLVPGVVLGKHRITFSDFNHPITRSPPFSASPCLRGRCPVLPFRSRRCRAMPSLSAIPILPSVIPSGA
jgi:hypothetical protein